MPAVRTRRTAQALMTLPPVTKLRRCEAGHADRRQSEPARAVFQLIKLDVHGDFMSPACCDSLIMSPRGLVRNVPLDWRPWRSRSGADSDECERAATGRDISAGGGGNLDVEV